MCNAGWHDSFRCALGEEALAPTNDGRTNAEKALKGMTTSRRRPSDDSEHTFAALAAELEERIRQHDELRDTTQFRAEQNRLRRLTTDFVDAVRSAALIFTRYPNSERWLLQSSMDDFIESAVSIHMLGEQGVFNVGRREPSM